MHPVRFISWFLAASAALGCNGCLERTAPHKVAMGAARLTVRHAGAVAKLIDSDTRCGFGADTVKRAAVVQGQPGEEGAVVLEVKDCRIAFPMRSVASTDCEGVTTEVVGTVTVSGTKRIRGNITGDAKKPVLPTAPDAVTLDLEAKFDNFEVFKSNSSAHFLAESGTLRFVMEPRLGLSKSLGICAVTTLDVSFPKIEWKNGYAFITDGARHFGMDIEASNYSAQVGKWLERQNDFKGSFTVWGAEQKLPADGEPQELDSEYTPEAYFKAIACTPDLATPVSYACPSLKEQIAHGASRLAISELGALTSLIEADARCGFSNPAVLGQARLSGAPGNLGTAVLTLPAPCVLSFPAPTPIGTNCSGVTQSAQGMATITGTKTLSGVLSGDTATPVVPDSRDPAAFALGIRLDNFVVTDSASSRALKFVSGTLQATVRPRVAIDSRTNICSQTTSIVQFENVTLTDTVLELTNDGLTFRLAVAQGTLNAQSGTKGERTNFLEGTWVVDGQPLAIPPPGLTATLDPSYDEGAFTASFACKPGLQLAPDEASCSVDRAVATNVARLLMLTAGTTASQLQGDTNCGFSAFSVKTNPTRVTGEDGQMGELEWNIQNCRVGQTGPARASTDCLGITTYISGTANVTAQRIVRGERDTQFLIFDSIVPRSRDALQFTLTQAQLADYSVFKVLPGMAQPFAKLTLHGGTLSGKVSPRLGERISKPGTFDVGTPVATFSDIQLRNATATLEVGGKRFSTVISAAQLSGQNGTYLGVSNTVYGTVTLGSGRVVTVPMGTALDPAFTQAEFDSTYSCTADLKGLIPPN